MNILSAQRVVTGTGDVLTPGWLSVVAGVIEEVAAGIPPDGTVSPGTLAPGFVDIHCHGGGGASFESGDPAQVVAAASAHRRHGTTSLVASLVSASADDLLRQVAALAELCDDRVIAGIHLEGPWLSAEYRGAHDPAALRRPTLAELDALVAAGRGHVRMVTLAPERSGALETVRACAANGVVAAIGHTNASYAEVAAAVEAGATVATHLFNAMRPLKHRDPGPIAALTEDPRVTVELIADGVHLDPAVLRFGARAASGRVALVTDAMSAAGAPDGPYVLGGMQVLVVNGIARLLEGGAIAGSTLTMDRAVRHSIDAGLSGPDEVLLAATARPAQVLSLRGAGELTPGARADLVLLDPEHRLVGVWAAGEPVALD